MGGWDYSRSKKLVLYITFYWPPPPPEGGWIATSVSASFLVLKCSIIFYDHRIWLCRLDHRVYNFHVSNSFSAVLMPTVSSTSTSTSSVSTCISSSFYSVVVDQIFESSDGGSDGIYILQQSCSLLHQVCHFLYLLLHFLTGYSPLWNVFCSGCFFGLLGGDLRMNLVGNSGGIGWLVQADVG